MTATTNFQMKQNQNMTMEMQTAPRDCPNPMRDWPCFELADVLANQREQLTTAVEAARQELRRRSFSTEQVKRLQAAFNSLIPTFPISEQDKSDPITFPKLL